MGALENFRIYPDRIGEAVDEIDSIKSVVRSSVDPKLLDNLEQHLGLLAKILRLFHHVFDAVPDSRTMSDEVTPDLIEWCREYDRDFRQSYDMLLHYRNNFAPA